MRVVSSESLVLGHHIPLTTRMVWQAAESTECFGVMRVQQLRLMIQVHVFKMEFMLTGLVIVAKPMYPFFIAGMLLSGPSDYGFSRLKK